MCPPTWVHGVEGDASPGACQSSPGPFITRRRASSDLITPRLFIRARRKQFLAACDAVAGLGFGPAFQRMWHL